jgi:ADP-ribose pyrophosphatase
LTSPLRPWAIVDSREVFTLAPRVSISVDTVKLPDGRIIEDYCQIRTADHVVIYAETEENLLICLQQYRHGSRRVGLTLPAGNIEADEKPLESAKRELLEETGYGGGLWFDLGKYPVHGSQGVSTSHLFVVKGCAQVAEPNSGDLEEAIVELYTKDYVLTALRRNEFLVLSDAAAIGLAALHVFPPDDPVMK